MALYYCPVSGVFEDDEDGGFDICCDYPELHLSPDEFASVLRRYLPRPIVDVPLPPVEEDGDTDE